MQILKNRHLVIAMLVTPLLAVIAWFAVDYSVSEKPHAAVPGRSYQLVARSNCRYQSGICTLSNGDIEVQLTASQQTENSIELQIHSQLPIRQALVSWVAEGAAAEHAVLRASASDMQTWQVTLPLISAEQTTLRLALNIDESTYYAETAAVFFDYKTTFSRENFASQLAE